MGEMTMKTYNHLFTTLQEFEKFLTEQNIDCAAPMVLRIHTGVHASGEMSEMLACLHTYLPNAQIIGCSSISVIYNGRHMNEVCLLSLTMTEQCAIDSAHVPCFENGIAVPGDLLAERLCDALSLHGRKGILLAFVPQLYYHCSRFARKITELAPNVRLVGGVANQMSVMEDGRISSTDYTFTLEGCSNQAVSAAVILDEDLYCYADYALGVERISDSFRVTDYKDNTIRGVDDIPAFKWLVDMTGEHVVEENQEILNIFPLIRSSQPDTAWAIQLSGDSREASVFLMTDDIEPDETICIGYVNPNVIVDEVNRVYREIKRHPAETLFVYSCTLRKKILQNCSAWETGPLKNTCASGAFLGGEFFYDGTSCRFGNCAFTLTSVATQEVYPNLNTQVLNNTHNLHHDNEHLVDYLSSCAMGERSNMQDKGEIFSGIRSLLYADKTERLGNMTKLAYDIQVRKLNKLCLIAIRNASELIAYAGYRSYHYMFQEVLSKMQAFLREYGVRYYLSEQGEILICGNDQIEDAVFEQAMRRLDQYLVSANYFRLMPVFEFCLVLHEVNLLRSAKVVQSVLRTDTKKRFIVYSKDMGFEERNVHDVQMLHIINEALSHQRVQPFYQGIYDNNVKQITMFESLMRLTDEDGKLYFPNEFFPVARKYGLYGELSRCLIDKVMRTFEDKDACVTMNLSMQDILDPAMTELIYGHMQRARHPEHYVFEVVETEDIDDYKAIGEFADRIHQYGGKIALDDFGSGFSNLVHVIGLDLDYLKVDGGIIRKICEDPDCRSLLELVAVWCRLHNKKVIAEFVENQDIQMILCEYNVDYSQGYFFSKPARIFD